MSTRVPARLALTHSAATPRKHAGAGALWYPKLENLNTFPGITPRMGLSWRLRRRRRGRRT
eukprot:3177724-Rhodomonas_salina.3